VLTKDLPRLLLPSLISLKSWLHAEASSNRMFCSEVK